MGSPPARYVLGLNQYTHSAACCLLAPDGEPVCALAKERLTRKKFDGGDTAELVRTVLEAAGLRRRDLGLVVANNHLFRIRPYEEDLPWTTALHQYRPGCLDPFNLLPGIPRHEISHHLAHAWSVLPLAPFDEGLILVMDGIGSTLRDLTTRTPGYSSDADLPEHEGFVQAPPRPDPAWGWREAESAYAFRGLGLRRVFKRWTRESTPVFLYNYGFENMESLGALYSRVSSHVFGDWNACGKVMGLAPWDAVWNRSRPGPSGEWLLRGPLERLKVNWKRLKAEPHPNAWAQRRHRRGYARLAAALQADLERVVLAFLRRLRRQTGLRRLCLTGGVALNSTLNGRIVREAGFEEVFIPSYPGDEGVAVGCALFGRHVAAGRPASAQGLRPVRKSPPPARTPFSPFLGRAFGAAEIATAVEAAAPFVEERCGGDLLEVVAAALQAGRIAGWFQGRSEFGPRALGNRSLLAAPFPKAMAGRLNSRVKKRESFRPFAPTVLAEEAGAWFPGAAESPCMSLTVPVAPARRRRIPAVVHVDGTARIQTLRREDNPRFYDLIRAFERRTGLPMVLNTSFNVAGEPIVDTPADALRCFLEADIDLLVLEDRLFRRRPFPGGDELDRLCPVQATDFRAEVVSGPSGEAEQVTLLAGGFVRETDSLALGVLEACDGRRTARVLAAEFQLELEAPAHEVMERLERLYTWRLIRFEAAAG